MPNTNTSLIAMIAKDLSEADLRKVYDEAMRRYRLAKPALQPSEQGPADLPH